MRKKWLRAACGMLIAAGIVGTVPVLQGLARALDAEKACTLTIAAGSPEQAADLNASHAVIDLYRVADISPDKSRDTYSFVSAPESITAAYAELDFNAGMQDAAQWKTLAEQAADIALSEDAPQTPVTTTAAGVKSSELQAGLYLLVPHADGETAQTYLDRESMTTVIYSERWQYRYTPELVALPNKANGNTADSSGDWLYDLSSELKPEQTPRKGSLEIIKHLNGYHAGKGKTTCVFDIVGTLDGTTVFSDVRSIDFTESGTGRIVIEGIPVGTQVTVREVYSGASYKLTTEQPEPVIIPADGAVSVSFTNEYHNTPNSGSGITNTFRYEDWSDEQGEHTGWHWIRPEGVDGLPKSK